MKAVLFDLDNTLYPEIDFVKSGFAVVSRYLAGRYNLDEKLIADEMFSILQKDGRGKVFDTLLKKINLYSDDNVKLLLYLYRSHRPTIKFYPDVIPVINKLQTNGYLLAIITDGMASVQKNKVDALKLNNLIKLIIYTDELGRECWKPSTISYKIALNLMKLTAEQAIYIGDDISKDFIGPNELGMTSIQIVRNNFKNIHNNLAEMVQPKIVIKELKEILDILGG